MCVRVYVFTYVCTTYVCSCMCVFVRMCACVVYKNFGRVFMRLVWEYISVCVCVYMSTAESSVSAYVCVRV